MFDHADVESLLPTEKEFSVVQLDYMKHPASDDAAVKMFEVDSLEEAAESTPEHPSMGWVVYNKNGEAQQI